MNNLEESSNKIIVRNFTQSGTELKYLIPSSVSISKINLIANLIKPVKFAWIKKISGQNKI